MIFSTSIFSQEKYTLSGYIKEAESGEYLIGANIFLKETFQGVTTNQYGFYSITLKRIQRK